MATLISMPLEPDIARNIDDRARIAEAMGDPLSRKLARIRLGMTQDEVSEATGLSVKAIRLRERQDPLRRRVDIEAEIAYAELLARAVGKRL
jgi:DNA-binding XRE family transcriptional regulator